MQRNFILTDIMKTGFHLDLEEFISMHTMKDQSFECTGEYYTLHNYDLDSYDRRFAVIDCRMGNWLVKDNAEYKQELQRRIDLLRSQGFVFIKSNPWESSSILEATDPPPRVDIDHVKWTGDCSWFWWYMFRKHKEQNQRFCI